MAKQLIDTHGRHISYLRLSLTDKCNLRCFYCLPKGAKGFTAPKEWLSFAEIERVVGAFAALGVNRIRLTGGEPLLRPGAGELISQLAAISGVDDLSLSTNASYLAEQAAGLKESGISRINVSLDSLNAERFAEITGGGELQPVLDGLAEASRVGLSPIKINMVAMKGINDDEFAEMLNYCQQHGFTLRLIETMPMGIAGQQASDHYLPLDDVRQQLQQQFDLVDSVMPGGGPARYMQSRDGDVRVGFITPMSQHFCESCNRVRLSADGVLYLCMGQEYSLELRPLLRDGCSDQELQQILIDALALKPAQHDFNQEPEKVVRFMSRLGG